jgi:cytochrome c
LSAAEIEAIDQTVFADGEGLPPGSGNVAQGNTLFESLCASCHGPAGTGGIGPELAYGRMGLTSEWPDKTIGTYWPYATSLFDFLRRAMPMSAPGTLSDDESYALTAYLLYLNGIVTADTALDATALAHIRMPNRDGFEWIDAQPPQPQP